MDEAHVVVYSSNASIRRRIIDAVGHRSHPDLGPLRYTEIATAAALIARLESGGCDVVVLDGEAAPAGGLGIARQLKDELTACPPIVVLVGRPADLWLAKWSKAEAAVSLRSDPVGTGNVIVEALRKRVVSLGRAKRREESGSRAG